MPNKPLIVLISANITEQMGGEGIKGFQFIRQIKAQGNPLIVIAHERTADEIRAAFSDVPLKVVEDDAMQRLAYARLPGGVGVSALFHMKARRFVREIAAEHPDAVFHYLCPVSPMQPRFPVKGVYNVLGPLTGNIYYPDAFRREEPKSWSVRRTFHRIGQWFMGSFVRDKRAFDRILVSGGERTRQSLRWAGVRDEAMIDVIDSGVSDRFRSLELIRHEGVNRRFMTSGRLVHHKGVALSIEALSRTKEPVCFDIFGGGEQRAELEALVERLGLSDRVRFMGWAEKHDDLLAAMGDYRGYVVPSLAEANGIVVQEAMVAGLPVICLKWGGPTMLADDGAAIMIDPVSREAVLDGLASAMDRLAIDADGANAMAERARAIAARRFFWDNAAEEWQRAYPASAA